MDGVSKGNVYKLRFMWFLSFLWCTCYLTLVFSASVYIVVNVIGASGGVFMCFGGLGFRYYGFSFAAWVCYCYVSFQ